jgi:hypothetical protein
MPPLKENPAEACVLPAGFFMCCDRAANYAIANQSQQCNMESPKPEEGDSMTQHRTPTARTRSLIAELAQPVRLDTQGPFAARFIYSLRLIAAHERVRRDPVPELTLRLGGVEIAAKALAMSQAIAACWPENVHVSRFCCCHLTHDEATVCSMLDAVAGGDRNAFEASVTGLVRPDRIERLWDAALALLSAEMRAS